MLSVLNRLHNYCSWLSAVSGAGGFAPSGTRSAAPAAAASDIPDFGCGRIDYDSDLLSRTAFEERIARGFFDADHNIAVAYVPGWTDGPYPGMVVESSSGTGHSEIKILDTLAAKGISPDRIQALYTERQPCPKMCGPKLAEVLNRNAKVSWAVPWTDNATINAASKDVLKKFINAAKRRRGIISKLEVALEPGTAPTAPPGREPLPLALAAPARNGRRS
ncbi:nucleic acid/nucleotide deaminase domain-containing protein [Amycolatopsis sp. cmx-4-68]|uniref:nucleic acid/nucleotide deaminase domain-containing protein n=1 Tax=Amycolatopsis sp. cmx-4-68 TaxID=2790938 RepID=UPI0039787C6A